jgi:hypothetical protein
MKFVKWLSLRESYLSIDDKQKISNICDYLRRTIYNHIQLQVGEKLGMDDRSAGAGYDTRPVDNLFTAWIHLKEAINRHKFPNNQRRTGRDKENIDWNAFHREINPIHKQFRELLDDIEGQFSSFFRQEREKRKNMS